MPTMKCELCGAEKPSPDASEFSLLDYCAVCSADLCDKHMQEGCCGHQPALSGMEEDRDIEEPTE